MVFRDSLYWICFGMVISDDGMYICLGYEFNKEGVGG